MKYDVVINLQRFSSTGFLTAFSGAPIKIGFNKNPFSFMFTRVIEHKISTQSLIHETERNQKLIEGYTDKHAARPKIYTTELNRAKIESLVTSPYIVIAPASVWFTKQFPIHKWISFLSQLNTDAHIVFIGSADDRRFCARLIAEAGLKNQKLNFKNLCGELSIQDSAELMKNAILNFVNDSAPMHIASSVNAKTAAIFCSTVPEFGFGPLSDHHHIIQIHQQLSCRPCGLHGLKSCPEKHFNCANGISDQQLLELL
jgi:heptosyltransferase II